MLTIFTIPKSFKDSHINIIQRNAIRSWILLRPKCEIILFGDEEGTAEIAKEFGIRHIPEIEKNEFGTPFLNSVFNLAQKLADNHLLAYINTDIILMSDFIKGVEQIDKKNSFLMFIQRWNLDIEKLIQFNKNNWQIELRDRLIKKGSGPIGADCFIFPRDFRHNLLSFIVRPGWDNWLLYQARLLGIPLIDATKSITIIHQNHDYSHYPKGGKSRIEIQNNLKLLGGLSHVFTPRDADWIITNQGLEKRKLIPPLQYCYRWFGSLSGFYPYFNLWLKVLLFPGWLLAITTIRIRHFLLSRRKIQIN